MLKLIFQTMKVLFLVLFTWEKRIKFCISLFHTSPYFRHIIRKVHGFVNFSIKLLLSTGRSKAHGTKNELV